MAIVDKCKWFGHKWSNWVLSPTETFNGFESLIRKQARTCERCCFKDEKYL